jgi:molecular chaperone Hsp33
MSELHKFIFEGLPVRGALVRLTNSWQEMLTRRAYPEVVRNLLGEMTAASVLMHSNIKFDGSLILQIMAGDKDASPVKLAVSEVRSNLSFRSTAKVVGDVGSEDSLQSLINRSKQARCAITLDPQNKLPGQQPYQGIVPLHDASIAAVLEHYMLQSEQLDTQLVLAADGEMATGLLIQRMPGLNPKANEDAIGKNEDFNRIAVLTASIKSEELLNLSTNDILHRLFWNEPLQRFEPQLPAPRFQCTCNREKVAQTIRSLGQSEAERTIEEQNGIHVNCDFCGQSYDFDVADAAMLFIDPRI